MKNLKAPFLVIALLLLNGLTMSAESSSNPPAPTAKSANLTADDEDCQLVNCQADFPIDQNINFLLVGGLALGVIMIYKNQTKKASI
ncbi:hypothetical protein [Flavobacterium anhuiense]|uniref:hypothetical protein n=1 Tax=Flavobacterium anhuiense TaxID=459526 RepID=UPI00202726C6|nr:hypothetical protein [Flavobacterium anhuiense]URM37588.1 hypothetical protein LLY39_03180 [Flavobacterium anhuiense]